MSHPSATQTASDPTPEAGLRSSRITVRSVILGAATAAVLNLYADYAGMVLGSSSLVKSQYPMAMLLPFALWLFLNTGLKAFLPRAALTGTELLVIYSMSWIAGAIPMSGWAAYWASTLAVPTFYASPENRWQEVVFDVLPWWSLADTSPGVIRLFYDGLSQGESIPWIGWVKPLFWWTSVSMAVLTAGICISIIFQRQWEDAERLTFPLAQFAVELTSGFDEPGRVPGIFRNRIFWTGFAVVFGVFIWNIVGYFEVGFPEITVFAGYRMKEVKLGRDIPSIYLRVLPTVVGLTYFCSLDILLSFWALRLLAILKLGVMNRTGFSIGLAGQKAEAAEIMSLESHGAMVLLAVWSVWASRGHLGGVWRAVRTGAGSPEDDGVIRYRIAAIGLAASTVFIAGWMHAVGMSIPIALLHVALLYVAYLTVAKYTAASGFPHLLPVGAKGGGMLQTFVGTANLSPRDFAGIELVNSSAFFGNARIPAWPALPHHFRLLDGKVNRRELLAWIAVLAFLAGLLVSFCYVINLGYSFGGQNLRAAGFNPQGPSVRVYDRLAADILESDPTAFDPAKMAVWLFGALEVALLVMLRNRIPWWPLHPLGLAFQDTTGPRVYAFSIFLTWSAKLLLLRIGGIVLYRRAAPFFIGLSIGYVSGILVSSIVDYIWFPTGGHVTHGW